jgi:hypothetical protein
MAIPTFFVDLDKLFLIYGHVPCMTFGPMLPEVSIFIGDKVAWKFNFTGKFLEKINSSVRKWYSHSWISILWIQRSNLDTNKLKRRSKMHNFETKTSSHKNKQGKCWNWFAIIVFGAQNEHFEGFHPRSH